MTTTEKLLGALVVVILVFTIVQIQAAYRDCTDGTIVRGVWTWECVRKSEVECARKEQK